MLKLVSKKLTTSKSKISKSWQSYRTKKAKILGRKLAPEFKRGLIEELRLDTRKKISNAWSDYREYKITISGKSDFGLFRTLDHANSTQKFYKARKNLPVEKYNSKIESLIKDKNVVGVLAVMKVRDEESGKIIHISDFITKNLLDRLNAKGISIYEHVAEHAKGLKSTQEFTEVGLYIRVIYAKT